MDDRPDSDALTEGAEVGAYRIVKRIGSGGTGVVYEAVHRRLDKRVALKTLLSAHRQNEEIRQRFLNEGITASRVRHPHVVDITDVGETTDVPFLVMELLEGEPLSTFIKRNGAVSPTTLAGIMVPVAAALAEAHRLGVIHRDLKPDNVFLTRSQQGTLHPKVLDFGISKVLDADIESPLTTQDAFLGTPSYASPEQIDNGAAVSEATDQYSFGVVLYELATGHPPFQGYASLYQLMKAVSLGDFVPPSIRRDGLDPALDSIIRRAMSLSRRERFESMRAVGRRLLDFTDDATYAHWLPFFEPFDEATTRPSVAPPRRDPASAQHEEDRIADDQAERDSAGSQAATAVSVPHPHHGGREGRTSSRRDVPRTLSSPDPAGRPRLAASPSTPHRAVSQSIGGTEQARSAGTDSSPPRWLGWAALAVVGLLGVIALLSGRRPGAAPPRAERIESLSPAGKRAPALGGDPSPAATNHGSTAEGSASPYNPSAPQGGPARGSPGGKRTGGGDRARPNGEVPLAEDAPNLDPGREPSESPVGRRRTAARNPLSEARLPPAERSGRGDPTREPTEAPGDGDLKLNDNLDPWQ